MDCTPFYLSIENLTMSIPGFLHQFQFRIVPPFLLPVPTSMFPSVHEACVVFREYVCIHCSLVDARPCLYLGSGYLYSWTSADVSTSQSNWRPHGPCSFSLTGSWLALFVCQLPHSFQGQENSGCCLAVLQGLKRFGEAAFALPSHEILPHQGLSSEMH